MAADGFPARVRVARAYKGMSLADAGAIVNVSARQWSRYESGDYNKDREPLTEEQLRTVAEVTGVPAWFILGGWDAEDRAPILAERVEALERKMDALLKRDADVEIPTIPDELVRPPGAGSTTTQGDRSGETRRRAAGGQRGTER